jgi:uncharacterized tellurite resistance protein B-like protein
MISQEKLFDAFGELIYAVAQADGLIQNEEISTLNQVLAQHEWAKAVQWSFDYEKNKQTPIQEAYSKALDTFKQHGPAPEYTYLIEIIEAVAKASAGIDSAEKKIIDGFQSDLKAQFIKDLEKIV